MDTDRQIPFIISYSLAESKILLSFLRAYGLRPFGASGHIEANPALLTALGGYVICLPESEMESGVALLESLGDEPVISPRPRYKYFITRLSIALLLLFTTGVAPPPLVMAECRFRRITSVA